MLSIIYAECHLCRECELKKGSSLKFLVRKLKSFLMDIAGLRLYSGPLVRKCIT
jgi:hypothetical protein